MRFKSWTDEFTFPSRAKDKNALAQRNQIHRPYHEYSHGSLLENLSLAEYTGFIHFHCRYISFVTGKQFQELLFSHKR